MPQELQRSNLQVFAQDECGNYFVIKKGAVAFWDHETSEMQELASSQAEFIAGLVAISPDTLRHNQVKSVWVSSELAHLARSAGSRRLPQALAGQGTTVQDVPTFFVPASAAESTEADYEALAKIAQRAVPELSQRIYSISYRHDGEDWVATVGQTLHGSKTRMAKSGGRTVERRQSLADPATVLAIFPGVPYVVVTNHRLASNVGSRWENPFFAGQPSSVQRFTR